MQKACERFLNHIQRSVFEGNITKGRLERLERELEAIMDTGTAQCTIYKFESLKLRQYVSI